MKYYFIVNPHSGSRDKSGDMQQLIEGYFAQRPELDYEIVVTERPEKELHTVAEICKNSDGQPLRICACGGDGTLNGVAGAAVGHDNVEIGYYPCGSGNDFIKCFAPAEQFRSIDLFVEGKSSTVDIIKVNEDFCLNLFSVGVDADVNYCLPKYRRLPLIGGYMGYNMAVIENFFKPMGKKLKVTVDGRSFEGEFMLSAFGNGRVYGGGYYATPEAKLDDGIMDIVLIDKIGKLKVASVLGIYKKGEHIKDGQVTEKVKAFAHFMRGTDVEIESPVDIVVNVDGESFVSNKITAKIIPGAVKFVAP